MPVVLVCTLYGYQDSALNHMTKEDFEGDFDGYFKGSSRGCLRGTLRGTWRGTWRETPGTSEGTSNSTWKGTCCQAQVMSRSGHVQVSSGPGLVQITAQI